MFRIFGFRKEASLPLGPQAEALLKKMTDSGVQPFETMTLAEDRPELTAPPIQVRFSSRLTIE